MLCDTQEASAQQQQHQSTTTYRRSGENQIISVFYLFIYKCKLCGLATGICYCAPQSSCVFAMWHTARYALRSISVACIVRKLRDIINHLPSHSNVSMWMFSRLASTHTAIVRILTIVGITFIPHTLFNYIFNYSECI